MKDLAKHKGGLCLGGITTLSDEAVKALSQHKSHLALNGLTKLSEEAAKALVQRDGDLYLDGLTTLLDATVKALSRHKGCLSLNGLTTLSDVAVKALAQHDGSLLLNGLTTLSDEAARTLSQHRQGIELDGLTTLSDEAAKAFGQKSSFLMLNGLTTLSDAAAKALSRHRSGLSLNGLTTLSDAAQQEMATCEDGLWLEGLTTLTSASLARRFADTRHSFLNLYHVRVLSDEAAKELSQHKGHLVLDGLTTLSDEAAKELAQHKGDLDLDGLTTLSNEAARALGRHDASRWLSLRGLTNLTPQLVSILRRKRRPNISPDFERRRRDIPARVLGGVSGALFAIAGLGMPPLLLGMCGPITWHSPISFFFLVVEIPLWFLTVSAWRVAELTAQGYSLCGDDEVWYADLFSVVVCACHSGMCLGFFISCAMGLAGMNRHLGEIQFVVTALVIGLPSSVYIAPSLLASARNHPNKYAIMLLNYLAGWMFIPWVVALVWASLSLQPKDE